VDGIPGMRRSVAMMHKSYSHATAQPSLHDNVQARTEACCSVRSVFVGCCALHCGLCLQCVFRCSQKSWSTPRGSALHVRRCASSCRAYRR
jgi:hypothetical protein